MRPSYGFRGKISVGNAAGAEFPWEDGRYHMYVCRFCDVGMGGGTHTSYQNHQLTSTHDTATLATPVPGATARRWRTRCGGSSNRSSPTLTRSTTRCVHTLRRFASPCCCSVSPRMHFPVTTTHRPHHNIQHTGKGLPRGVGLRQRRPQQHQIPRAALRAERPARGVRLAFPRLPRPLHRPRPGGSQGAQGGQHRVERHRADAQRPAPAAGEAVSLVCWGNVLVMWVTMLHMHFKWEWAYDLIRSFI